MSTPRDSYLPTSKLFGNPRRDAPKISGDGEARIGGEQDTADHGNACAPAVEQPDVVPWEPLHIILAALAFCLALDAGLLAACLWAFRGLAC
jgi:hypothetical protein